MKHIDRIALILVCACGLLALGAAFLWAVPCESGIETATGNVVPMRCHYTANVGGMIGVLLAAVSAAVLVAKRNVGGVELVALLLISCVLFILSFETPFSIGVCKSAGTACAATAIWLRACGAVAAVASVAAFVANPGRKRV